jgi:L-threonylcarbamoyladenylate synthase
MNIWDVTSVDIEEMNTRLQEPAALLRQGGIVAFPTETVYGLGANAYSEEAVQRVFQAKGRPSDNPLIVHIADLSMLSLVTPRPNELPAAAYRAMEELWPGPLTVIMPAHPDIAQSVRPGLDNVGVRLPAHPVAQTLIRVAGCPIAAPSANLSGKPSPTTAQDVIEDMQGRVNGVVDGGACPVGLESTVVSIGASQAVIYRPGGISREQLEGVLQIPVVLDPHLTSPEAAPQSPGMKYRHYAPNASVHVWWGSEEATLYAMLQFIGTHAHEVVACIVPTQFQASLSHVQHTWSPRADELYDVALSRELYRLLRAFDREGANHILVAGVPPEGYGAAVMNRLQKAAEGRLHRV